MVYEAGKMYTRILAILLCTRDLPIEVASIEAAKLTVSPNKQYFGTFLPITPATQRPVKNKTISSEEGSF